MMVIAVSLVPTKLSALVLVASMLMAAGGSVFAQASHLICVAKQHECGKTATIAKCCCGQPDASRTDSTTALIRVEVRADLTLTPALPLFVQMVAARPSFNPAQTSPPRLCLLDLPTLFSTLLI